jgi:hypothetical protein
MAERLGVGLVLEGTLQRSTARVHVTATLIDAARERGMLPPLVIDCPFDDMLRTQDDVARELSEGIAAARSRPSAGRYSQQPDRYEEAIALSAASVSASIPSTCLPSICADCVT